MFQYYLKFIKLFFLIIQMTLHKEKKNFFLWYIFL